MNQKQILDRIAKMKADKKDTWLSQSEHKCPGCGEVFRLIYSYKEHLRNCIDYKYLE